MDSIFVSFYLLNTYQTQIVTKFFKAYVLKNVLHLYATFLLLSSAGPDL